MKKLLSISAAAATLIALTTTSALATTQMDKAPLTNQTAVKAPDNKSNAQTKESWDWGNKGQATGKTAKTTASSGQKTVKPSNNNAANKAMNKTDRPAPKVPAKAAAAAQSANQ